MISLFELIELIAFSAVEDWHCVDCWDAPSYHTKFEFNNGMDGRSNFLFAESHDGYAVYKSDVSIALAFGLTANEDFNAQWANKFPDPRASSAYIDIFYNNALVYREKYVKVDGNGAKLPIPINPNKLRVPRSYAFLIQLVDELEGNTSEFEKYFRDAGLKRINDKDAKKSFYFEAANRLKAVNYKNRYLRFLRRDFNDNDLHDLCFELNIIYDDLPGGNNKHDKSKALVDYCEENNLMRNLIQTHKNLRPRRNIPC